MNMRSNKLFNVNTKAFFNTFTVLAVLFFSACSGNSKNGYVITGTVEGASDGDVVTMESIQNMESTVIDKAIIKDGKFTFEGKQDSVVARYLSCLTKTEVYSLPFFLENGEIKVIMRKEKESVTGTPNNDIYQEIRDKINTSVKKMSGIYKDSKLTDEQKEQELDIWEAKYDNAIKEGMEKNIENVVGIFLFKLKYFEHSLSENEILFDKIPEKFLSDPELIGMKKHMEYKQKTDVNKPFTDVTMQTLDGKTMKLSDYVAKGKPVLVDFWASWCAPCRQSMPELIEIYNKYKGKFEIVGISLDENKEDWENATNRLKLPWIQMSDLKGWKSEAVMKYGIHAIPHTILIDNNGIIVAHEIKGIALEKKLEEIIK